MFGLYSHACVYTLNFHFMSATHLAAGHFKAKKMRMPQSVEHGFSQRSPSKDRKSVANVYSSYNSVFLHHSVIWTHLPVPEPLVKRVKYDMLDIVFYSEGYERNDSVLDEFVLLVSEEGQVMDNLKYRATGWKTS